MTSLYQIAEDFQVLKSLDPDETDPKALLDTLEGIEGALKEKGQSIAALFQNWDADVAQMKEAEKRMAKRRKAVESQSERLKVYLLENMEKAGIESIACPEFEVKVVANPASVLIEDEAKISEAFLRTKTTTSPDKAAIKAMLTCGIEVEGCSLIKKNRLKVK